MNSPSKKPAKTNVGRTKAQIEQDRLAKALKANLQRRKAAASKK